MRGTNRPFNGEYAYAPRPVDLSYGLIGCREPYHLDRGSSPTMTSALRDAGTGVDGGYPLDRRHPADGDPNVSIHRSASPCTGRSESVVLLPHTRPTSPMNPPFIR